MNALCCSCSVVLEKAPPPHTHTHTRNPRSVRFDKLLRLSFSVEKASLLVGSPGTAKTCCINQFIRSFNPETTGDKTITFSSLTTPGIFQVRCVYVCVCVRVCV